MYAIVEINGKQYKAEKDSTLHVDLLGDKEDASEITLDKVLLFSGEDKVLVGTPYLDNVKITANVLGREKGRKVRGIKFKKRKNYTRTLGSRKDFSMLKIKDFQVS